MKRSITAILAGGAVFGATVAFAATLGVDGQTLGAGDDAVASCDTNGVVVDYAVEWDNTDKYYEVDEIVVTGIAGECAGKTIEVQVVAEGGALEDAFKEAATAGDMSFEPTDLKAQDIGHIGVTIYDEYAAPAE